MRARWLVAGVLPFLACATATSADRPSIEVLAGLARWEAVGTARCAWLSAGERPIELLLVRSDIQGRLSMLLLDHLYAFDLSATTDGGFTVTAMDSAVEDTNPPGRLRLPAGGLAGEAELAFNRAGDVCKVKLVLPADLSASADATGRAAAEAHLRAVESVVRQMAESSSLLRVKMDAKAALAPGLAAHQQATELLGSDHSLTATAAVNLGSIYWNLGQYEKAREMAEAATATFAQHDGFDAPLTLDARKNAALYRWELGDFAGARLEFERVRPVILARFGERSNAALAVTSNLAVLYLELGLVHESLEMLSFVYLAREARDGPTDRRTLVALNNLAHALGRVGRADDARQLHELSFERHRAALGARHPDTLLAHHNVAAERCLDTASECPELADVARVRAEVLGPDHPDTLQSQGLLGAYLLRQGNAGEALPLLEAVYEGRVKKMSARHWLTLGAQANAAHARALTTDSAAGLRQMQDALASMDEVIGPTNHLTLQLYAGLAKLCERLSRPDCRREALKVVVNRTESERGLVLQRGPQQVAYTRQWVPLYRALAWLQAQDGDIASAVRTIERSKGRGLLASLGLKQAERFGGLPPEVSEAIAARERELAALDNERLRTTDAARITQIDVRQSAIARDLALQRAELRARYPKYAAATEIDVPDARELARFVARDEIFVGYAALDDGFLVYTAEANGKYDIRFVRLPHAASAVDAWRAAVGTAEGAALWRLPDGAFHAGERPPAAGARQIQPAEVAEYLAAPLLGMSSERLVRYRRWIISPDGPLVTVPFETLPWQGKRLAESVDVRYAQSLAVYRLLRQRASVGSGSLFAMGGPTFGRKVDAEESATGMLADKFSLRGRASDAATLLTRSANDPEATRKAFVSLGIDWAPLPAAEREAKAVAAMFPGAMIFTGDDASEERLQQLEASGELGRFRYLLFATHGYLSLDAPALSAVVLRQPGSALADGYVTAAEWAGFTLRSDLIVLSACETGLGKDVIGEGVMGLPYAMFVAGNRNTLLSLWKVPDASTAEFIVRFFGKLRTGTTQVAALAQTKREMMNSVRFRDPVHWAGFVLYGS